MGFFQRRAEQKASNRRFTAMSETVAQLAARDMAVGVLMVADNEGQDLKQLRPILGVILSDNAPRAAVDAGVARAIDLKADIAATFPTQPQGVVYRSLSAAVLS